MHSSPRVTSFPDYFNEDRRNKGQRRLPMLLRAIRQQTFYVFPPSVRVGAAQSV
jgi:hypothetical protein